MALSKLLASLGGEALASWRRAAVGGRDTPGGHALRAGTLHSFSCSIPQSDAAYRVYNSMREMVGRLA